MEITVEMHAPQRAPSAGERVSGFGGPPRIPLPGEGKTSVRPVGQARFRAAAAGPLAGILGVEDLPLVSADFAGDTRSSVVDALSTLVTDGTLLKVYAWYDNEMGYACRMVDLACLLGARSD